MNTSENRRMAATGRTLHGVTSLRSPVWVPVIDAAALRTRPTAQPPETQSGRGSWVASVENFLGRYYAPRCS